MTKERSVNSESQVVKTLCFSTVFFLAVNSHAVIIDFGATQFSQSFKQLVDTKASQTFYNLTLLASLRRSDDRKLNFGWTIISSATSIETSAGTDKFSSLDMGPALRWGIDERSLFVMTLAYGIYAKGTYAAAAGTSENLTGTSTHFKMAIEPQVNDSFNLGVSLNYYSPSYNKSVQSSVETDISYKGTQLFPAISMAYRF